MKTLRVRANVTFRKLNIVISDSTLDGRHREFVCFDEHRLQAFQLIGGIHLKLYSAFNRLSWLYLTELFYFFFIKELVTAQKTFEFCFGIYAVPLWDTDNTKGSVLFERSFTSSVILNRGKNHAIFVIVKASWSTVGNWRIFLITRQRGSYVRKRVSELKFNRGQERTSVFFSLAPLFIFSYTDCAAKSESAIVVQTTQEW